MVNVYRFRHSLEGVLFGAAIGNRTLGQVTGLGVDRARLRLGDGLKSRGAVYHGTDKVNLSTGPISVLETHSGLTGGNADAGLDRDGIVSV